MKQLSMLLESQQKILSDILALIEAGKKIRSSDIDKLFDSTRCGANRIVDIFGVSKMTLNRWNDDGCPRNVDKTYSIGAVYKWREEKLIGRNVDKSNLPQRKLEAEIALKEAQVKKINGEVMDRDLVEQIMTSRASSLRNFFEKTFMANAVHLAGKNVDEVRVLLFELLRQAMDAYIGKAE